ncbi:MAG: hypothetical protein ACR2IT_13515 [Pirellulales bacterium]
MATAPQPLDDDGLRPFDVITVPDFSEGASAVFEARTLVFLATWLEHAGTSRRFPLHLACIGDPPPSIRRLAERCEASITVHQPLSLRRDHHVGNKLRGLEIEPETDRFLLLDVDVAILSDLAPLSRLGTCVAACPDDAPNLTLADWRVIYDAIQMPTPRLIPPLVRELDLPRYPRKMMGYEAGDGQLAAMVPYFNGGVVFAPWDCGLRDLWEQNIVRVADLFDESKGFRKWIHNSDQAALAVSLAMLEADGWTVRRLPDAYNARWQHLYAGTPALPDIAVLHCCWSFLDSIAGETVSPATMTAALDRFFNVKVKHRYQKLVFGDLLRLRPLQARQRWNQGRRTASTACDLIDRACRSHLDNGRRPAERLAG